MGLLKISDSERDQIVAAIDAVEAAGYTEAAIENCINTIRPTVLVCFHGKEKLPQIRKLLASSNAEGARHLVDIQLARQFKGYVYPTFFLVVLPLVVILVGWALKHFGG